MDRVAFLKVACKKGTFDLGEIHKALKEWGFSQIRPEKEYTPKARKHFMVVWLNNNREETLPDYEGISMVGAEGCIYYAWHCDTCAQVAYKCVYPGNHSNDWQLTCC